MNLYVESNLSASDRRILINKRVGNSWIKIKTSLNDTIVRSFLKCGIFIKSDMSEDNVNKICGLEGCKMSATENKFHLEDNEESDDSRVESDNHGRNILRLFDTLPNFLFTTSETKRGY